MVAFNHVEVKSSEGVLNWFLRTVLCCGCFSGCDCLSGIKPVVYEDGSATTEQREVLQEPIFEEENIRSRYGISTGSRTAWGDSDSSDSRNVLETPLSLSFYSRPEKPRTIQILTNNLSEAQYDESCGSLRIKDFEKRVGIGGEAYVYLVIGDDDNTYVAKLFKPPRSHYDEDIEDIAQKESGILSRIRHDNIAQVRGLLSMKDHAMCPTKGIILDYYPVCMSSLAHDSDPIEGVQKFLMLTQAQKIDVLGQVMAGVKALHDADIAYCDIKPRNIMLTSKDLAEAKVKIIDFGCARSLDDMMGTSKCSPLFVSRDMLLSQYEGVTSTGDSVEINRQALQAEDWWALGVTFFYLETGKYPVEFLEFNKKTDSHFCIPFKLASVEESNLLGDSRFEEVCDNPFIRMLSPLLEMDPGKRVVAVHASMM